MITPELETPSEFVARIQAEGDELDFGDDDVEIATWLVDQIRERDELVREDERMRRDGAGGA